MLFSTVGQAYVFLVTVALGAAMGFCHDFVRLLCAATRRRWMHWLYEAVFFAGCLHLALRVLLDANGAEIRGYTLLGMAVGWGLYLISISRLVQRLARAVAKVLQKFVDMPFLRQFLR